MAVRVAVAADIPRIFDLVCCLREAVDGPAVPDQEAVSESLLILIASPTGLVLVTDGGFIAGNIAPTILTKERFAFELGWYATDGNGLRLLSSLERWADNHMARVRLSTASWEQTPVTLRKVLLRRGYRPFETAWIN